ncbi:hypothetical protein [Marinilactibacillus sp. Marseille-P9653]|uniref:hypothetical protein n=1 Tax=Marinilactibacillus sp. Marseille-P9653 TaxID=2866583 RepID=UPI001CE42338|nr:hypothetical protein [Marinilactibacillus sp. Marseille-P9653]
MIDPSLDILTVSELSSIKTLTIQSVLDDFKLKATPHNPNLKSLLMCYRKEALIKLADLNFVEVKKSWTKNQITDTLSNHIVHSIEDRLLSFQKESLEAFVKFAHRDPSIIS